MPVVLKDLWVGDKLLLTKSNRMGTFLGIHNTGKARVQVNNKIVLVPASNLSLYHEKEPEPDLFLDDTPTPAQTSFKINKYPKSIDLHIEVLAPHLINQPNFRILDEQVRAFEEFIDESYKRNSGVVTVIHGKGEGILRAEIQHRLKQDSRIKFQVEINGGGATEVFF